MSDDDNNEKRDNVHKLMPFAAQRNRRTGGPQQSVTGTVTFVADLRSSAAVAFRVQHGREETMFWISTATQATERDYRMPLYGETVTVWFNDKAQNMYVPGEDGPARGVTKLENVSGNSEDEAFRWFRERYPEAYAPKKPDDKGPGPK